MSQDPNQLEAARATSLESEINLLRQQNATMHETIISYDNALASFKEMQQSNLQLQKKINELNQELEKYQYKEMLLLNKDDIGNDIFIEQLTLQNAELEQQNRELKNALDTLDLELNKLRDTDETSLLLAQIQELSNKIEVLEYDNGKLKHENFLLSEFTSEIKSIDDQKKEQATQMRIKTLEGEIEDLNEEIVLLYKKLEGTKTNKAEFLKVVSQLEGDIKRLEGENQELKDRIALKGEAIQQLEEELNYAIDETIAQEQHIKQEQSKRMEELVERINYYKKKVRKLKQVHEDEIADLNDQLFQVAKNVEAKSQKIEQLGQQLATSEEIAKQYQSQLRDMQVNMNKHTKQIVDDKNARILELQQQKAALEYKISELEGQLEDIRYSVYGGETLGDELMQLEQQSQSRISMINDLRSRVSLKVQAIARDSRTVGRISNKGVRQISESLQTESQGINEFFGSQIGNEISEENQKLQEQLEQLKDDLLRANQKISLLEFENKRNTFLNVDSKLFAVQAERESYRAESQQLKTDLELSQQYWGETNINILNQLNEKTMQYDKLYREYRALEERVREQSDSVSDDKKKKSGGFTRLFRRV